MFVLHYIFMLLFTSFIEFKEKQKMKSNTYMYVRRSFKKNEYNGNMFLRKALLQY
jgi:hypothetical protein